MKRIIVISIIWLTILSFPVQAKDISLTYRIYYDSEQENLVEIKNKIVEKVQVYFDQVDGNSVLILLSKDLSYLESDEWKVVYKRNRLIFMIGDGKGEIINGNFAQNSFCMQEVKPKSLLRKWFNF